MNSFLPIAYADIAMFMNRINKFIINPLIILVFVVALAVFLFGIFEFIAQSDNEEARLKGRSHIMWGLIGMFIMIAVFTIMRILINTLGVDYINTGGTGVPTLNEIK